MELGKHGIRNRCLWMTLGKYQETRKQACWCFYDPSKERQVFGVFGGTLMETRYLNNKNKNSMTFKLFTHPLFSTRIYYSEYLILII